MRLFYFFLLRRFVQKQEVYIYNKGGRIDRTTKEIEKRTYPLLITTQTCEPLKPFHVNSIYITKFVKYTFTNSEYIYIA